MKYIVTGADGATGKERTLMVEAIDEREAVTKAKGSGILPYKIAQDQHKEAAAAPVATTALPPATSGSSPEGHDRPAAARRSLLRHPIVNAVAGIAIIAIVVWVIFKQRHAQEDVATFHQKSEIRLPANVERSMRTDYYAKNMSAAWLAEFDEQMRLYEAADAEWWARFDKAPSDQKDRMLNERQARQASAERAGDGLAKVRDLNKTVRTILQEMR
jgi:hypothetical protein